MTLPMHINKALLIILMALSTIGVMRAQNDTLHVRMMAYNLRFGELATLQEIGLHIKSFAPDFVALEEVDINSYRGIAKHQNGKNFIAELSSVTGMFSAFGKGINLGEKGYFGNGILSKYPIIKTETLMLPNPRNTEQRVLLCAWIDMGKGDTIVVGATHLCYLNEDTKFVQGRAIINKMNTTGKYPKLVGGDFNMNPFSITYNLFLDNGWLETSGDDLTWPTSNPKQKLDYIFAYPASEWHVIKSWAIPSKLSDHLPILVDLEYIK